MHESACVWLCVCVCMEVCVCGCVYVCVCILKGVMTIKVTSSQRPR